MGLPFSFNLRPRAYARERCDTLKGILFFKYPSCRRLVDYLGINGPVDTIGPIIPKYQNEHHLAKLLLLQGAFRLSISKRDTDIMQRTRICTHKTRKSTNGALKGGLKSVICTHAQPGGKTYVNNKRSLRPMLSFPFLRSFKQFSMLYSFLRATCQNWPISILYSRVIGLWMKHNLLVGNV